MGSRHERKLRKYSDSFMEMFRFFLHSYRVGLTFSGQIPPRVVGDPKGMNGKEVIRQYEDGRLKGTITTRHPNVVHSVINGKKSWGFHVNQWSEGISECLFSKEEIVNENFDQNGIKVPESLMKDLDNRIRSMKMKRYEKYLEEKERGRSSTG